MMMFFKYSSGDTNWQCVTRKNGSETITDSGVAWAADIINKFKIVVNATATSVGFYINDALVQTHTTNIPYDVGTPINIDLEFGTEALANNIGATVDLISDVFYERHEFTNARG